MARRRKKIRVSQIVVNVIIWLLLFIMLYPLAMTFWGAFKNPYTFDTTKWYPTLPLRVTNLSAALPNISHYIINTVVVAAVAVTGSVIIAALAAYAFARLKFVA